MSEQSQPNPNVSLLARQLQRADISELHVQPAVIRSADQSFSPIRNLPKQQAIVLFTPAIPSSTNYDPFEPLGRAILSHHPKVRHVPYSLKDGYTYVHEAHIMDANVGAIVVVVVAGDKLEEQSEFASAVIQKIKQTSGMMPVVNVWIGKGGGSLGYDSVVRCSSYDSSQLRDTASLIFETTESN
jgi:hypothetical protein